MPWTLLSKSMRVAVPVILALVAGRAASQDAGSEDHDAAIRRGVELHDAGNYEAAIRLYQGLLESDPHDAAALYEMSMSYSAAHDFDRCIDAATRATGIKSPAQAAAFTMLASCQDDAGRPKDALKTFSRGIKAYPKDASLNFNYGVTLMRTGDMKGARKHLQVAIEQAPMYSTPYLSYAQMLNSTGQQAASMLMDLRFIMAEPNSSRAIDAAERAVKPFQQSDGRSINIGMGSVGKGEDDTVYLELAMGMGTTTAANLGNKQEPATEETTAAADATSADAEANAISDATRFVAGVKSFLMLADATASASQHASFLWRTAAAPLNRLEEQKVLDPFLFHVASLARLDGAVTWLRDNDEQLDKLGDVMHELEKELGSGSRAR